MKPARSIAPGTRFAAGIVAILLLCWPAFLNGGAFFFPDTSAYLRGADAAVHELTGWSSVWSDKRHLYDDPAVAAAEPVAEGTPTEPDTTSLHPVLLGRSIYYGLAIFPFIALLGSIGAVLFQAALAVFVIRIALVAFGADRAGLPVRVLAVTALLAGLTSLPFFVSLLMPDLFAGLAIVLAISAAIGWRRLSTLERVGVAAVLILSATTHSSHVLILLALFGVLLLLQIGVRASAPAALALVLAAALSGVVSERLFVAAVAERLGEPPIRPPFLTARLISEGPGFRLLSSRCPTIGFEACRYVDRMPRDSDTFLWSFRPQDGVFSVESHAVQRKLAEQDFAFALATLRDAPGAVIQSSLSAMTRQLFLSRLDIFNAPARAASPDEPPFDLPESFAKEVSDSRYAAGAMPVEVSEWAVTLIAIAAALYLAWIVAGAGLRRSGEHDRRLAVAALAFLLAVVANAFVSGAMSKPHNRYNSRVIWVLPLGALAIVGARRRAYLTEPSHAIR